MSETQRLERNPTQDAIRTADVLAAVSLASDLAVGLPAEHGIRSCYIAMRLARALKMSGAEQADVYYTALLMDVGCTAWTSQIARLMMADEIAARRDLIFYTDPRSVVEKFNWLQRNIAVGASLPKRARRIAEFAIHGSDYVREGFHNTCDVARTFAARLGMTEAVQQALFFVFEQWDGQGFPTGLCQSNIPAISRIVYLSAFFEAFHNAGGRESAVRLIRRRRGGAFDPSIADILLDSCAEPDFWEPLESQDGPWAVVMELEPKTPQRWIGSTRLLDAASALADFADMKSSYTMGHSRRVAAIVNHLAEEMAIPQAESEAAYLAALTHDVGLAAVPSFISEKPQEKLTPAEWEQIRLHPYHGERILAKVPALQSAAELVGAHHERPDGQGYYRGVKRTQIPLGARILAVADQFDELTHDAPGRPALAPKEALHLMEQDVGGGLSPEAFDAIGKGYDYAHGTHSGRSQRSWPRGLTDREVEVLRLAARGLSRPQMAHALYVSDSTVRSHLEHIYNKIGVSSRAAAALFALEHGLLD